MQTDYVSIAGLTRAPSAVVVIDVMRAFTTTAWAFARGARRVVLAEDLDQARTLKGRNPDWITLTDGEPVPGIDTVNSPGELRTLDLAERTLVQKTRNGTTGAQAARHAPLLLCAGFTVAAATARLLLARRTGAVTFVVTGGDGRAEEDLACAEYIAALLADPAADPAPYLRRAGASKDAARLAEGARSGLPGIHADDLELCLEADRFPFAMAAAPEDGLMTLRPLALTP
ncbi:2-phosphosulfolactate phosphatase [Streptomyces sp. RB5]|uniref:Probable 2-phosphosulfolactate phosphatase n=1 Tax=Streptomyces smaragdinus TaxID=2585196 RepID=A0A7K0CEH8_9ACTN|nr:2-phosphosulfolactate phosphatase [Streptomyces smaragdinus]MQY11871.1 2-phosphosulfolactate phosphatase [Streptomyces smaragdinus]